jgi:hypothetical protein
MVIGCGEMFIRLIRALSVSESMRSPEGAYRLVFRRPVFRMGSEVLRGRSY